MSRVQILPPEIVSKIAAGEVIERPASVVKELVENAIDAQSDAIEVNIKRSGKTSIQIKDTGIGIEPDDMEKIFLRHSTSKIRDIDDLYSIRSLGFRGEALYSIASIADVTLRTKTGSNDSGWEIHVRGGEKKALRPVSMPKGTQIEVKELFFNTPARRKFLKSDTTEFQQILNIFIPYVLLYPEKRFTLLHNDKVILEALPNKNILDRIAKSLKIKKEHILEIKKDFPERELAIRFLLGDINIQRTRKDMQFIFINNRPVQNYFLSFHINDVYNLIFPKGVRPFFAVYLDIAPGDLDVNVHPTKREVKIKDEQTITPLIRGLCEQTLMSRGKPKEISEIFSAEIPREATPYKEGQLEFTKEKISISLQEPALKEKLSRASYTGSFLNKYLFFESGASLLIIDQHSAQERITYEELLTEIQSGRIEIQRLLTPYIIKLTFQEKLIWENLKTLLEKIGFETTLLDNETIAVHTHPQLIKNPETAVRNVLSEKDIEMFDIDAVAKTACRSSIMAGDRLMQEEIQSLRNRLILCKDPFTCPHGRPTVIEIKEETLAKEFLRK